MKFKDLKKEFEYAKENYFISKFERSIIGKKYKELTEEEKQNLAEDMREDDYDDCNTSDENIDIIYFRKFGCNEINYIKIETELERSLTDYEKSLIENGEIYKIGVENVLYESKINKRVKFLCKYIYFIYDSDIKGNHIATYEKVFPTENVIYVSTNLYNEEMLKLKAKIENKMEDIIDNEFEYVSDNLEYDLLEDMSEELDKDLELEELYI